jgi:hypothetical protein
MRIPVSPAMPMSTLCCGSNGRGGSGRVLACRPWAGCGRSSGSQPTLPQARRPR